MTAPRVLIIGNNMTILKELKTTLLKEKYEVTMEIDGSQGVQIAQTKKPDIVILSTALQRFSSFEACRILRQDTTIPILIVGSEVDEIDTIIGLNAGADDYIANPISVQEIIARVRAKLRRIEMIKQAAGSVRHTGSFIQFGDLDIDLDKHLILRRGSIVNLGPIEFHLLSFFIRNQGKILSRKQLLDELQHSNCRGSLRTVDAKIHLLRQKIEDSPIHPRYIFTVWGVGYRFGKPRNLLQKVDTRRNHVSAIKKKSITNELCAMV